MKIIDERSQVADVAERWKAQYCSSGRWGNLNNGDPQVIYQKLLALSPDATAKDVAAIIGNTAWAGPSSCHECGEEADRTVQIGQAPDYESATAEVCESCIRKALALFELK